MTTSSVPAQQGFGRVIIMAAVAAIGGFLFGFNEGIIAGAIVSIKKLWTLSPLAEGIIVSSVLVGGLVGAAIGGKAADAFGRRAVISATAAFFVVGAFWTGLATSPEWLIAGRILIGLSIGTVSVAGPLYLSEIAPASIRGALVSFNQLALVIGVLCSYVVSAAFSGAEQGWRYMLMTGAAPAVVLGYGMLFLPSSPRWLMTKGYEGSARRMLRRLGIRDVDAAVIEIKQSLEAGATGTWR
jgi:MFS family permease